MKKMTILEKKEKGLKDRKKLNEIRMRWH